jgi:hypothetical protein
VRLLALAIRESEGKRVSASERIESLTSTRAWTNQQHNIVVPTVEDATPAPPAPPAPTSGLKNPMFLKDKYDYVVVSTEQLPKRYSVAILIAPLITPFFTPSSLSKMDSTSIYHSSKLSLRMLQRQQCP